jgi:kynurenine 3-monooxygenase
MKKEDSKEIIVLGAGLVGSLLSIYLARRGYSVHIYERRPDMRKENIPAGRSINLALSDRGWRGLKGAGIEEEIRKVAIPMHGRMMHSVRGELSYQPYGEKGQSIFATSRGILNCVMMTEAEKHGVTISFNERCTGMDLETATVFFEDKQVQGSVIFGSDGAYSAARLQMQLSTDRFNYSQSYLQHGYKELLIPAGENESFRMEKHALHIWPRGGYMLIALPNIDGSFTCTLFFPYAGEDSFSSIRTKEDCTRFFQRVFPDVVPMMPTLLEDFFQNPTGSLVTVKCFPWSYRDRVCLIGDSAHAILPFYGQGMNCGFEDCVILDALIGKYKGDWGTIFREFQDTRKPDGDAIAELAYLNFIEMRDRVGSPHFLLQKKIEARIHERHPSKWLPLYSQVTFSEIPYSTALANGKRQEEIMQRVMQLKDIETKWDSDEVEQMILKHIA